MSGPEKTLPIMDAEAISAQVRARLAERRPFLVVLAGADVGTRFRIEGSCVMGRDPNCEFVLRDHRASARHARFEVREMAVFVADLGSTNGTLVNEAKIKEARVDTGDKVFIGSTVLKLDWQDALEQEFHDELERLVSIDELTGLMAKRRFDAEGAQLVAANLQAGRTVAVFMMDLDGIKKINDTHGHAFGAHCIAQAGALIGKVLGPRGMATRWGGDEYSAIAPGLDASGAAALGEEMLEAIVSHGFVHDGVQLTPGISIGLAVGPAQGETLETLQRRADEALYRAKRAGKGRVSA